MHILTQESETGSLDSASWEEEDKVSEGWTVGDEYSYESDFVMDNVGVDQEFDQLGTNKDADIAQCKLMSLKLAELIKRQDCNKLADVFGLSADSFATKFAPLIHSTNDSEITNVFEIKGAPDSRTLVRMHPTNVFEIECVSDSTKLSAMTGDHLVLIYAIPGWHLVSFTSKTARKTWSDSKLAEFKHDGAHYFDSFVFGRLGARWKFSMGGSGWRDLNVDKLMK